MKKYRMRRGIGCLTLIGGFPQKSPVMRGSYAERLVALLWLIHSSLIHMYYTGWQRGTGCLFLWGLFSQKSQQKVALLQKETCNLRHPVLLRNPVHISYLWYIWHVRHHSSIYVWHNIDACDKTHLHAWHDWCMCVTWRIHMCDMTCINLTHSHAWHVCDRHSCVRHYSSTCMMYVTRPIHMCVA